MNDKHFENMMIKFLVRNYPVSRIKFNDRFRRGIIFDNGTPHLLIDSNTLLIKQKLITILNTVFNCDKITATRIITQALNI
jgi:hypothetical protein